MTVLEQAVELDHEALAPAASARVNLMPPEIAERARFRRIQAGLGAGLLSAVAVVISLHVAAAGEVADAEAERVTAVARGAALQAQTAEFADVEAVYAQTAGARTALAEAMSGEVRFSRFLHALSITIPEHISLAEASFTQAAGVTGTGEVGTVSFSGLGRTHDDVAVWLETLAAQPGYANPTFTGSTAEITDGRRQVTFTSTVTLTDDALSRRYTAQAGG